MCLEVEDIMFEDAVKYIENQMQSLGKSVKKMYLDVMHDLLPPSSCDLDEKVASELHTDAGFCKKSSRGSEKIIAKANSKRTSEDSWINHDVDDNVMHAASCDNDALSVAASGDYVKGNKFISHARQYVAVGTAYIKSNLGSNQNQQNKKTLSETTLSETDACQTSQSCELSNEDQNHAVSISKRAYAEVTMMASVAGCCNEIENVSTEPIPNDLELLKSAEEKEIDVSSSSSSILLGDPDEILETWNLDATRIEETCVMVSGDALQLVPKARGNLKTNKKKGWQPFSLSKKSARKQEYEELVLLHGNNEKGKGDCMENLYPTLLEDQKKPLLPGFAEPEWELL